MNGSKPRGDRADRLRSASAPLVAHGWATGQTFGEQPLRVTIAAVIDDPRDRMAIGDPLQAFAFAFEIDAG